MNSRENREERPNVTDVEEAPRCRLEENYKELPIEHEKGDQFP
jgi:hypothetical protein